MLKFITLLGFPPCPMDCKLQANEPLGIPLPHLLGVNSPYGHSGRIRRYINFNILSLFTLLPTLLLWIIIFLFLFYLYYFYFLFCSKYINNTDISAGETPDILDAWPTEFGLCWFSFCLASRLIPFIFS